LIDLFIYLVTDCDSACLQAKAPDANLLPIREDAEELVSTLNKLDTPKASYCLCCLLHVK